MRISIPFIATVALLAGTIWTSSFASRRIPESLARPLSEVSMNIDGWKTVDEQKLDAGVLKSLTPTDYLSRTYRRKESQLDLFIAFYAQQRAGESMHSPKHCLPGGGWEIWRHDSALISTSERKVNVNKYSIQNSGRRMLMLYWYQSANRIVASEYLGKVLLARDSLFTGRTAGSIVRIMVADTPGAEEQAIAFAAKVIGEVQACFVNSPASAARM